MTATQHQRLRSLFERALELPAAERAAWLEVECGADRELRARLTVMLAAAADEHFLSSPTAGDRAADTLKLREGAGSQIGPYKLLKLIGEGGFGSVFLAEQERPVARKVALKIIKLGMDTGQVVARFEQERQALALMDHPHIARVIDAGATETGRPYFVMDLVQGEPIAQYCDEHQLSIDERLELFAQVCNAVQHAHAKGIIHRDLKSSNVLVSTQDGRAHAKVIDFGIAKATSAKLSDKTVMTEQRQIIGTLEAMSPEQADGSLDIDTRTDVYSLGVLLYQLLTGSTPFTARTFAGAFHSEIQRIIREVEPSKPSTRLNESSETLASIAAQRRIEPKRLGTLLRGELDWIVMKALEKDRTRRYATADSLAQDVRRFLTGEAVVAAPPSASYRLQKFVRRNRGSVIAGAAVALALLVGAIGFAWQARLARIQRDLAMAAQHSAVEQRMRAEASRFEADKQRGIAEASATAEMAARERAEAFSDFVTDALRTSDPTHGGEQGMLVSEALLKAAEKLEAQPFENDPDIEASLRSVIADILYHNASAGDALPIAERALELYQELSPGEDDQDVANTFNLVATIHQELGHFAEAEPLFEQCLEMQQRLNAGDDLEVSRALNNLAIVRMHLGRAEEAEPLLAASLVMKQRLFPGDNADVAMSLNNLATVRNGLGRHAEADELREQSLAMYERLYDDHPHLAMALFNRGQQFVPRGRLAESEQLLERALAMYQRLFRGDHPDTARALGGLANTRKILGRAAEADALFVQSLEMLQRLYPGDHPQVATRLRELAQAREEAGRLQEADELYTSALEMKQRLLPGDNPDVAQTLIQLAQLRQELDRPAEAEALLTRALGMLRRFHGGDAIDIARALNRLSTVYCEQKRFPEALSMCEQATEMNRRLFPGDHPLVGASLGYMGLALEDAGRTAEAEASFVQSLEMFRRMHAGDHFDIVVNLMHVGRLRRALGRTEEALALFDESAAMERRRVPGGSTLLARALWSSGSARLSAGDAAAALPVLEEAVALGERLLPPTNTRLADYRGTLAECRAALGQ